MATLDSLDLFLHRGVNGSGWDIHVDVHAVGAYQTKRRVGGQAEDRAKACSCKMEYGSNWFSNTTNCGFMQRIICRMRSGDVFHLLTARCRSTKKV